MATDITPCPPNIITRKEARAQGKPRYFTGKPCVHGHIAERGTNHGVCVECIRLRSREQYRSNPAGENARRNAIRLANPEKIDRRLKTTRTEKDRQEYNRRWAAANPEKWAAAKRRHLEKRKQRMQDDPEFAAKMRAYDAAYHKKVRAEEAGRIHTTHCEICGEKPRRILYDHCHQSGSFRGWLCHKCNVVLGMARDSAEVLRRAADYLEKHKQPS